MFVVTRGQLFKLENELDGLLNGFSEGENLEERLADKIKSYNGSVFSFNARINFMSSRERASAERAVLAESPWVIKYTVSDEGTLHIKPAEDIISALVSTVKPLC